MDPQKYSELLKWMCFQFEFKQKIVMWLSNLVTRGLVFYHGEDVQT